MKYKINKQYFEISLLYIKLINSSLKVQVQNLKQTQKLVKE